MLAPLFKMLEASFELFVPLVVASMIDIGIRNQDTGYILKMAGVLVLLDCHRTCLLPDGSVFAAKVGGRISTALEKCAVCPY